MKRLLVLVTALLLTLGAAPAFAAPVPLRYLNVVVPPSWGPLTHVCFYYSSDRYVHCDAVPAANNVIDIQSHTRRNGPGAPGDFLSFTDNDSPGRLGMAHCPLSRCSHSARITFHPHGTGNVLYENHDEHGLIPEVEFAFGSHHFDTKLIPAPVSDINILRIIHHPEPVFGQTRDELGVL